MKTVLNQLFEHRKLSKEQAKEVLTNISREKYNPSQVAAFISVYLMRSISVDELAGFRSALLDLCIKVDLDGEDSIDVCGTGGDGKNTFNISTLTSFVVAGAGYKVAKHGNYGVSSVCGSSNVLEKLGYRFTNDGDQLRKELDKCNICFFHAPMFHPALKSVGPIRRDLGVKTFFNMLGPLVNPAQPKHQLVGVFSLKLARLYQYLHENLQKKYAIVHSIDGYDEISLTGPAKVITNSSEMLLNPGYFQFSTWQPQDIYGGRTIEEATGLFTNIVSGKGTESQNQVVLANSALAIHCFDQTKPVKECLEEAKSSIESGRAFEALKKLIEFSQKR